MICMPCRSSGLPCVEVPKHLEHRRQNSGLPPASLPPAMACPPLALFLLGALLAGEPSQGLDHLGVCKTARGSRRPLQGSKSQWAGGTVFKGAVRGRGDLASVSPLVSGQIARVPLDSDSGGLSETGLLLSFSEGKLVWPRHCPAGPQGQAIPEEVSSSQWPEAEPMDIVTAQAASWGWSACSQVLDEPE